MGKLWFLGGAAVGYMSGTDAGRKLYEQIKGRAAEAWSSDPVQAKVDAARQAVKTQAPVIADKVGNAAKVAGAKIKDKATAGEPSRHDPPWPRRSG